MSTVDLSLLQPPAVVETLNFEATLAALRADFVVRFPDYTAVLESDPVQKLLEVAAYRELILRGRVNDAARGCMLATAIGTDLDHLAALFGVERLLVDPGDASAVPPIAPTYETDTRLRQRAQLALEGFSTAGPSGAYIYHALSASAAVLDASVQSPIPGQVLVTVLSTDGDGTAPADLLATVNAALSADDVRPLCDQVVVQSAVIAPYTVSVELWVYPGPDATVIRAAAESALLAYVASCRRIGYDVTLSGLYAAAHQPGVQRAVISTPATDLVADLSTASYCTGVAVTLAGMAV